jgi:hypothetical protein
MTAVSRAPGEIAHRLVTPVRNPNRGELIGTQQLRQADRVAPVGLHMIAWPPRDQRRRDHHAFETEPLDLPVQPVSGRPRLVTERQPPIFGGELTHQLRRRRRRILDLAEKPDLTQPTAVRNRDRITQL